MTFKKSVLSLLFTAAVGSSVQAGDFTGSYYLPGDLLIGFRKTGGGTYDLVVDAGSVATLTNLAPNTRFPITAFTGSQLGIVGTNAISWSAFAFFDESILPVSAQHTLFVTDPRDLLNTQTPVLPLPGGGAAANALVEGDMSSVWYGANDSLTGAYSTNSTATAVIVPENNNSSVYKNGLSYLYAVAGAAGNPGNFNGDFEANIENPTASNFTTAGNVSRSDFYQVPASGTVSYLGYFELSTNGSLTFVSRPSAAPVTPAVPVIKSIGVTNGVAFVSFTTGATGTYSLRGATSLSSGTAITNWPVISSVAGNGAVKTLTDANAVNSKFYIISAQ